MPKSMRINHSYLEKVFYTSNKHTYPNNRFLGFILSMVLTSISDDHLKIISIIANSPVRDKGYTRTYYSYPAKFLSQLPKELIKIFTKEGDLVFDPFCGGGTTGLESMLLNRRFIGYDINSFAIHVSKVKCTYINPIDLIDCLKSIRKNFNHQLNVETSLFDSDEIFCLQPEITSQIDKIFALVSNFETNIKNFFNLALIHTIKIIGRRDFIMSTENSDTYVFKLFYQKCHKMIQGMEKLPTNVPYLPEYYLDSNFKTHLLDNSVDCIITSPPYKDKDVEYQELQIQRRSINRSKRTHVISRILGNSPLPKRVLTWGGENGNIYWKNSLKSIHECYRVLKTKKFSFFWTGFKSKVDRDRYLNQLVDSGFNLIKIIPAKLSHDRAASSRSTHHLRPTKMMQQDFLCIIQK